MFHYTSRRGPSAREITSSTTQNRLQTKVVSYQEIPEIWRLNSVVHILHLPSRGTNGVKFTAYISAVKKPTAAVQRDMLS